jgi:hypothetical protein
LVPLSLVSPLRDPVTKQRRRAERKNSARVQVRGGASAGCCAWPPFPPFPLSSVPCVPSARCCRRCCWPRPVAVASLVWRFLGRLRWLGSPLLCSLPLRRRLVVPQTSSNRRLLQVQFSKQASTHRPRRGSRSNARREDAWDGMRWRQRGGQSTGLRACGVGA